MAQAKPIESLDKFLEILDKSKLFSAELMKKLRKELDGSTKQPLDIARMLVKNRKLSKWQASQLLGGYYKLRQDSFVLRDQLGKSPIGALFVAHDEKRNGLVAIRSLSKTATADADKVQAFLAAAKLASGLKHKHVARVLEVSSDADRHLLVTEFVQGRDLQKQVAEEGPLSPAQAIAYAQQIAGALRLAHQNKVHHGGLQPGCLLVNAEGDVKIADWGLAALRLPAAETNAAADVQGLGSTLYFLLSGQTADSTSVGEHASDLPAPLVELCDQWLTKDPEATWTIDEVVARLKKVAEPDASEGAVESESLLEPATIDESLLSPEAVETLTDVDITSKPAAKDVAPNISVGDSHKTATISDTAAFEISTGKQAAASPAGAFKISTKKKKSKAKSASKKEKTAPVPAEEDTGEFVTSAKPAVASTAKESPTKPAPRKPDPEAAPPSDQGADSPADPASPAKPAEKKKKKKKKSGLPLGLIIGGAALFGLMMIGGGGLLAVFLLSGGDDADVVAQATDEADSSGEADPESSEPEIDPEDIPDEIELVPDEPAQDANAAAAVDGPKPLTTGGALTEAPASDEGSPPATANTGQTPDAAATPAPAAAPGATKSADTDTIPPTDAADAAEKKKTADADAAAKMKAEADQKAAEQKKADDKKKADEKKKNAAPTFVFAPAITLPPVPTAEAAGSPVKLGNVNISETDLCFISLTGGDSASRGRAEFMVRNAKSGTAPRDWEFVVKDASEEVVIATLSLPKQELLFQWQPVAASNQYAGNLRNCSVKLTAGSAKPQVLALRKPVIAESLPIDLAKAPIQARWNVDSPPDPDSLQITARVTGQKFILDPPQPINASKGTQWIYLGENRDAAVLALKLDTSVSARGIQVTLKPYMTIAGEKPLSYNRGTKKKVVNSFSKRGPLQSQVAFLQDQLKKAPKNAKPQVQVALTQAEQGLQAFDKVAAMVGQLDQVEQTYNGAMLDFTVTYRTLQGETVLVETKPGGGSK